MNCIIKSHTNTYKDINEDAIYASENISFIIDGASGLSPKNHIENSRDVVWFVNWWKNYLVNKLSNYRLTIEEILSIGVKEAFSEYKKLVNNFSEISKFDYPSASIAIVRKSANSFEYFVLGDCTAIFRLNSGELLKIKDDRVTKLDQKVISLIETRRNSIVNRDFEFTKHESEMLLLNRMKKNEEDGYYVLEFDDKAIYKAISGEISISITKEFILSSDGFSISHESYGIIKERELFKALKIEGPNKIIEKIRKLELENDSIKKYPRLKLHDDCSVMHYENLAIS